MWSAAIAFRRSVNFLFVYETRPKMRYTAYRELNILKQMDKINFVFGLVTLLLYPLFSFNLLLFYSTHNLFRGDFIFFSCLAASDGPMTDFHMKQFGFWKNAKLLLLGTSDKKMQPHLTPVIFVFVGNSLFFITSKVYTNELKTYVKTQKSRSLFISATRTIYTITAPFVHGKSKSLRDFHCSVKHHQTDKGSTGFQQEIS